MRRVAHETFVGTAPTLTAIGPVDGIMSGDELADRLQQSPVLQAAGVAGRRMVATCRERRRAGAWRCYGREHCT